jgi:hypothetical protein
MNKMKGQESSNLTPLISDKVKAAAEYGKFKLIMVL